MSSHPDKQFIGTFILTSSSFLKIEAIEESLNNLGYQLKTISVDVPENPEQPFGDQETLRCASNRINKLLDMIKDKDPSLDQLNINPKTDFIISIENGIFKKSLKVLNKHIYMDKCHIVVYRMIDHAVITTFPEHYYGSDAILHVPVPEKYIKIIQESTKTDLGYSETVGKYYANDLSKIVNYKVPSNNWMKELGIDRVDQILEHFNTMNINNFIKSPINQYIIKTQNNNFRINL